MIVWRGTRFGGVDAEPCPVGAEFSVVGGTYARTELVSDMVVASVGVLKSPYELGKCGGGEW